MARFTARAESAETHHRTRRNAPRRSQPARAAPDAPEEPTEPTTSTAPQSAPEPVDRLTDSQIQLNTVDIWIYRMLSEWDPKKIAPKNNCTICLKTSPETPIGCNNCNQVIGCRRCVATWFSRRNDEGIPCCPLCRFSWRQPVRPYFRAAASEDEEKQSE